MVVLSEMYNSQRSAKFTPAVNPSRGPQLQPPALNQREQQFPALISQIIKPEFDGGSHAYQQHSENMGFLSLSAPLSYNRGPVHKPAYSTSDIQYGDQQLLKVKNSGLPVQQMAVNSLLKTQRKNMKSAYNRKLTPISNGCATFTKGHVPVPVNIIEIKSRTPINAVLKSCTPTERKINPRFGTSHSVSSNSNQCAQNISANINDPALAAHKKVQSRVAKQNIESKPIRNDLATWQPYQEYAQQRVQFPSRRLRSHSTPIQSKSSMKSKLPISEKCVVAQNKKSLQINNRNTLPGVQNNSGLLGSSNLAGSRLQKSWINGYGYGNHPGIRQVPLHTYEHFGEPIQGLITCGGNNMNFDSRGTKLQLVRTTNCVNHPIVDGAKGQVPSGDVLYLNGIQASGNYVPSFDQYIDNPSQMTKISGSGIFGTDNKWLKDISDKQQNLTQITDKNFTINSSFVSAMSENHGTSDMQHPPTLADVFLGKPINPMEYFIKLYLLDSARRMERITKSILHTHVRDAFTFWTIHTKMPKIEAIWATKLNREHITLKRLNKKLEQTEQNIIADITNKRQDIGLHPDISEDEMLDMDAAAQKKLASIREQIEFQTERLRVSKLKRGVSMGSVLVVQHIKRLAWHQLTAAFYELKTNALPEDDILYIAIKLMPKLLPSAWRQLDARKQSIGLKGVYAPVVQPTKLHLATLRDMQQIIRENTIMNVRRAKVRALKMQNIVEGYALISSAFKHQRLRHKLEFFAKLRYSTCLALGLKTEQVATNELLHRMKEFTHLEQSDKEPKAHVQHQGINDNKVARSSDDTACYPMDGAHSYERMAQIEGFEDIPQNNGQSCVRNVNSNISSPTSGRTPGMPVTPSACAVEEREECQIYYDNAELEPIQPQLLSAQRSYTASNKPLQLGSLKYYLQSEPHLLSGFSEACYTEGSPGYYRKTVKYFTQPRKRNTRICGSGYGSRQDSADVSCLSPLSPRKCTTTLNNYRYIRSDMCETELIRLKGNEFEHQCRQRTNNSDIPLSAEIEETEVSNAYTESHNDKPKQKVHVVTRILA